jgi:hypothetical protein
MNALFFGHFAAIVASRILAKVKTPRAARGAVPIYLLDAALASVRRPLVCRDDAVQLFSVDSGTACAAA